MRRRLNPSVAAQHEQKINDLCERAEAAEEAGDHALAAKLDEEIEKARDLLRELKLGPERKEE